MTDTAAPPRALTTASGPRRPAGPLTPRRPGRTTSPGLGTGVGLGVVTLYLSAIVLIPLAAVVWRSRENGVDAFWDSIRTPEAWAARA